jgi:hypothetical protein
LACGRDLPCGPHRQIETRARVARDLIRLEREALTADCIRRQSTPADDFQLGNPADRLMVRH